MQVSELYLQRAAECERMAKKMPAEAERLRETANTWRWLARTVEDVAEKTPTVH